MPCPWSRRCSQQQQQQRRQQSIKTTANTNDGGVKMTSWDRIRRQNLRMLRKQTRHIVFFAALMEAMRVGPVEIVYAGKFGYAARGPEDYGIAYNVGYFLSWLYVCLFMVVFVPLFSWWLPASSSADKDKPSLSAHFVQILKQFNMVLLPFTIGICLLTHLYYTVATLIYVDARPSGTRKLPANNKKNWLVRLMLLAGIAMSLSFGYGAFQILEAMDLAHVKQIEYYVIVVPIQINLGLLLGSGMQWKVEKRIEKMRLRALASKADEEAVTVDEKRKLLDV